MSKYTTMVRYICENAVDNTVSDSGNVNEIIVQSIPKIFNFNFPIFDETYRNVLCTKILKHYYMREIGLETVGLWKLKLDTLLNEIMPYYNKLYLSELIEFNPLYTSDITREGSKNHSGKVDSTDTTNSEKDTTFTSTNSGNSAQTDYDLFSDTPQGTLDGVDNENYLTTANKSTSSGSVSGSNNGSNEVVGEVSKIGSETITDIDSYIDTVLGYEGKNPSKSLLDYRSTFLNIDVMIIEDLEKLFMQLW